MPPSSSTLLQISGTMLLMSAGAMTLFGSSRPVYRGYWAWVGSQWLLALGVSASAFTHQYPQLLVMSNLLTLQWPIGLLLGLRRFYARHPLRVPSSVDRVLITSAYLLWFGTWVIFPDQLQQSATFGALCVGLNLYTGVMMLLLREFRRNSALHLLALTLLTGCMVQSLPVADFLLHGSQPAWLALHSIGHSFYAVLMALSMVYACLYLTHERTELRLRYSKGRLRYLADIDALTKVPNRRRFHELSARTLSSHPNAQVALMMFDIDYFKRINDTLGHAAGDDALRQVGLCTRDTLRELDVAGRLGGDEFAVLLPDTTVDEAMTVAARIVSRLDARQASPRLAKLSLSFGVVQLNREESLSDALKRADQALYEAKRQGRGRAVIAMSRDDRPVFTRSQPMGLATTT